MYELKITDREDTKVKQFSNYIDFYQFVENALIDGFVYAVPIVGETRVLEVMINGADIVIGYCFDKSTDFDEQSAYDEETYSEIGNDYHIYAVTDKELIKYFKKQL